MYNIFRRFHQPFHSNMGQEAAQSPWRLILTDGPQLVWNELEKHYSLRLTSRSSRKSEHLGRLLHSGGIRTAATPRQRRLDR